MMSLSKFVKIVTKWTICFWKHKKHRCHPRVDIAEGEPGADYWHCELCYPCIWEMDETMRRVLSKEEFKEYCRKENIRRTWLGRYKKVEIG